MVTSPVYNKLVSSFVSSSFGGLPRKNSTVSLNLLTTRERKFLVFIKMLGIHLFVNQRTLSFRPLLWI